MPVTTPTANVPAVLLTVDIQYLDSNPSSDPGYALSVPFNADQLAFLTDADIEAITTICTARAAVLMPAYTIRHVRRWSYGTGDSVETPVTDHSPAA